MSTMSKSLTAEQVDAIRISARAMSVLSLLGSCYIISTFVCFPIYRKLINRLVFYATWGNIMANVATLISTTAIPKDPLLLSPLCEFQGVLIQWFMMADSLWVFCMATNVFLVFWHGHNAQDLYYLEKWYFVFAYGLPAIPPITYVIMDHHGRTRIIGSATLWCWVSKDVDWMRLAFFYGPVWLVIIATLSMYVATGIRIYKKGAGMRFFMSDSQHTTGHRDSGMVDEPVASYAIGKSIVVTTQIQHDVQRQDYNSRSVLGEGDQTSVSSYSSTKNLSRAGQREEIEATPTDDFRASRISRDPKPSVDTGARSQAEDTPITGYRATAFATKQSDEVVSLTPRPSSVAAHHRNTHTKRAVLNDAALAYLKVAFLMFIALFVVWVPSTINRLYQFVHKNEPNYALNIISAIVLPLQGAWNATIYIYTTRNECRRTFALIMAKLTGKAAPLQQSQDLYRKDTLTSSRNTQEYGDDIQLENGLSRHHLRHDKSAQ
ncbi:hypothetical protein CC86DRAFT_396231 [Ophiobolus disseminans]|uniref:G-protein coupled receptors family 2 profile 2 domain-containing protein n=1 Tax=Ophiobolus disseminans TaxID=1469910 RepID=A0A6A6ZRM0_9PLEO|nr:hypothetical protein CC86DRAFT_396231 [Ophiobolus disseminans]